MAGFDQGNTKTPWYGPQAPYQQQMPQIQQPQTLPQTYQTISQFAWITNPGVIDMWPIAAGSEMTFIDGENMVLYVKRVDEYNHPLKTRRFKLTEVTEEEEVKTPAPAPQVKLEDLKDYITTEVNKAVSGRLGNLSTLLNGSQKEGVIDV